MSGELLLQQLVNALSLGAIYALLALGLAMVFSVLGLLNFAYGELITITGYSMLFALAIGFPFWLAAVIGVAAACAGSLLIQLIAFRPLRGAPDYAVIFASFAVSMMIQSLLRGLVSPRPQGVPIPDFLGGNVQLGSIGIPVLTLVSLVVALAALGGLGLFLRYSRQGLAIRAAAEDLTTARLMGARGPQMIVLAFAISGILAGIAGVLWIARTGSVAPDTGFTPLLKAFVAVVLGGLGQLRGAVIGAFALAFIEVALQVVLPAAVVPFTAALALVAVVLVLYVRPQGFISGGKERTA